ncbi:GntR family transcriptional regulator [Spirillospora sp. NPDC048911]|uniref:GntR family transcriptional regulator n=1 Tax=Spirillospora sp. NPDC048911 TaxID=3364527 RepID=UPI00370FC7A9
MATKPPRYRQIAAELQRRIEEGDLQPGNQLPTEKELKEEWKVSESTVKSAMQELRERRLIETVGQKGSFVIKPPERFVVTLSRVDLDEPDHPPARGSGGGEGAAFITEVSQQGHEAKCGTPAVEIRKATEEEARALGIDLGTQVVCRSQQRLVNNQPNSLQTSYFDLKVAVTAQRLLEGEDIEEGTVAYLQQFGRTQSGYEDQVTARPPTPEERDFFGLSKATAVLVHTRTTYDQHGAPVRLTITVYDPARNVIRFAAGQVPDDPSPGIRTPAEPGRKSKPSTKRGDRHAQLHSP